MDKEFVKLTDKLDYEITKRANKSMKDLYKLQSSNLEALTTELAKVILDYPIEDNLLQLSKREKAKIRTQLNEEIVNSLKTEGKYEEAVMLDVLSNSAKEKNNTNSYVMNLGKNMGLKKLTSKQTANIVNQRVDGMLWSKRLWNNKVGMERTLKKEMKKLLDGKTDIGSIKKIVRSKYEQNAYNTSRLVNNELARVQSTVNDVFAEEHNIRQQMFMATLDESTSDECESYDGKVFDVDDPSKPEIPVHVNCRCTYVNVINDWKPTVRKDNITKEYGNWSKFEDWESME